MCRFCQTLGGLAGWSKKVCRNELDKLRSAKYACQIVSGRKQPPPEVPNRLARLREGQGLDRYELAKLIGVHERTIYRYEAGTSGIPDSTKGALATIFGVSIAYLMGWEIDGNGNGDETLGDVA